MSGLGRLALVLGPGIVAAAGLVLVDSPQVRIDSGSSGWRRLVQGADPEGNIPQRAVVILPGVDRGSARRLEIRLERNPDAATRPGLGVSIDRGPTHHIRFGRQARALLTLPPAGIPGLRLELLWGSDDEPRPRIESLILEESSPPWTLALVVFFLTSGAVLLFVKWRGPSFALPAGLFTAGLATLASQPALTFLTLPASSSVLRLLIPVTLIGGSIILVYARTPLPFYPHAAQRRAFSQFAALLCALVFGAWVRIYFLPSAGSFDTEYWKAWTRQASSNGLSQVYGPPESVPEGQFLPQLRGELEPWRAPYRGNEYGVDYPPLAMALWLGAWRAVRWTMPFLEYGEAENVASKLPAVLGDMGAVVLLLWAFRQKPGRGLVLAALYWALPLSWLSSAVLGFQDGAYAPLAAAALVAAGRGRAAPAGALLALACWVKPLAVVVIPVAAAAVVVNGKGTTVLKQLQSFSLGGLAVTVVAIAPYLVQRTMAPMVIHAIRAFSPGNLSSGYPNPWWVATHLINVTDGGASLSSRVSFLKLQDVAFPAAPIGTALVTLTVAGLVWRLRPRSGPGASLFGGAILFLAFCTMSVGVYENHPHLIFLLLLLTGLATRRLQILAAVTSASYVLTLLLMSGLGRFYGPRHALLEPASRWLTGWRMAAGFDLTLLLACVNTVVFVLLLHSLWSQDQRPLDFPRGEKDTDEGQ